MPKTFHYEGRDSSGNLVSGDLTANTIEDVLSHLEKHNIVPTDIQATKKSIFNSQDSPSVYVLLRELMGNHEVELHETLSFCRQLAALNSAGVPLIKAINQLAQSSDSPLLKNILLTVAKDIAAGLDLGASLKKHSGAFSQIVINTIEIGEKTGHLNEVLHQLSNYLEATIINRRNLMSALRYPILVVVAIISAMIIISFFVIPKFMAIFAHFKAKLPLPTVIVMALSQFLVNHWIMLLAITCGIILGIYQLLKIPAIHYLWDKKKLSLPILGHLQKRIILSQFSWTFSLVLRSGIPLIQGLILAADSTGNLYVSKQLLEISDNIQHGEPFSRAAAMSDLFIPTVVQMIAVGEEGGKLDELISEIAKYYDSEVSYDIRRLNELIEPILLAFLGVMILILALSVYLPMWDLISVVKH